LQTGPSGEEHFNHCAALYTNAMTRQIMEQNSDYGCCIIGVAYYPSYIDDLARNINKLQLCFNISFIIVVLNNRAISTKSCRDKIRTESIPLHILEHDNSGGEFGAYQAGVDFLSTISETPNDVLMLNDSVGLHYPFNREHISSFANRASERTWRKMAAGKVDYSERLLTLGAFSGSRWIRSNLMFIDDAALQSINRKIFVPEISEWIVETADEALFFGDQISVNTRERLSKWLFRESGWYASAPLSSSNYKKFRFKAQAILQEFYLTMRLENAGAAILGYELSTREQQIVNFKNRALRLARKAGIAPPAQQGQSSPSSPVR
jgi:hypothetical protein